MHAGFPCFSQDIQRVMRLGTAEAKLPGLVDAAGGKLIANGMALLLKLGFGYLLRDCLASKQQSEKAMAFFDENFVFDDPTVPNGERYYQGKFLIRTRKGGDDMNVWLRFCRKPEELFIDSPFGRSLTSMAVISTEVLNERKAQRIENDPSKVDLVIRFKDIDSIVGLIGREDVDVVGLLLENLVQLTGNVGHLFKLGAIATNIELELGLRPAGNA